TQVRREVEAEREETGFAHTEEMAVKVDLRDLPDRLEFDEDLLAAKGLRQNEGLAVPGSSRPEIHLADVARSGPVIEAVDVVEGVRQRNRGPCPVVEAGLGGAGGIGLGEFPIRIEIQFGGVRGKSNAEEEG